jgi:hypothetical protein
MHDDDDDEKEEEDIYSCNYKILGMRIGITSKNLPVLFNIALKEVAALCIMKSTKQIS